MPHESSRIRPGFGPDEFERDAVTTESLVPFTPAVPAHRDRATTTSMADDTLRYCYRGWGWSGGSADVLAGYVIRDGKVNIWVHGEWQ